MKRKKKGVLIFIVCFLVLTIARMSYLNLKYPSYKTKDYPSNQVVEVMGEKYYIGDGEVQERESSEDLKTLLNPDQVALKVYLRTTDKADKSGYLLYLDGEIYEGSYPLIKTINDSEYYLYFSFSKKLLEKKAEQVYITLPKIDTKSRVHYGIEIKIKK